MSAVYDFGARRESPDSLQFNYAMVASIALHMALLFSFSMRPVKSPPVAPGPIVARLAPPSAPAPAAVPAPAEPQPRVEPPAPPPQAKAPAPKPIASSKPAPAPKAQSKPAPMTPQAPAASPQAAKPPAEAIPSTPVPPSAGPATSVAKADPAPSAPSAPPADAGTLETYRMDLLRMARTYKRYPRVAMDNNWEGRVVVRMLVGANGLISSITVVTASGHEILDKQAIDMIQKAKPRVQIPAALRGREFSVEIPVIYSLKEPDAG